MTDTPSKTTTRRPDCVTEIRMGNTVLTKLYLVKLID